MITATKILHQKKSLTGSQKYGKMGPTLSKKTASVELDKCRNDLSSAERRANKYHTELMHTKQAQEASRDQSRLHKCNESLRSTGEPGNDKTAEPYDKTLERQRLERAFSMNRNLNTLQKCNALDQLLGGPGTAKTNEECLKALDQRDEHHTREQLARIHARHPSFAKELMQSRVNAILRG